MKTNNQNSNNSNNAESNNANTYKVIEKTAEQLDSTARKWNERAGDEQVIVFTMAERKKASSADAKNVDSEGYLPGIFWSGYVTTKDGEKHDFSRLDANGLCRTFENVCTWARATRATLLDGNANRTAEQRADDATTAIATAKAKPTENSVTAMLWTLAEEEGVISKLHARVMQAMTAADAEAFEKASAKETKKAKALRELEEARAAAEAATNATGAAIKLLLATGQYKTEEEVRAALGL